MKSGGRNSPSRRTSPRPAVERDDIYAVLNQFVAVINATVRHIPLGVSLGSIEGLAKPRVVNCDNLRTISTVHLVKRIAKLPRSEWTN